MIAISGLEFFDTQENISFKKRDGSPDFLFGINIAGHHAPLPFNYISSDSVSSFKIIQVDNLNEYYQEFDLNPSLITSDGSNHICDGLTDYNIALNPGVYYFMVNDRYESARFKIILEKQGVDYDIIECTLIVY
jgi:hypothetical protein